MERETAGDPISGLKWTRKTTDKIARQLQRLGIAVGRTTVGRLLRQMKYSLRTNRKKISAGSTSDRDRQFRYLCQQRDQFERRGDPVLSVDAKKRELIGNFKNPGARWSLSPIFVGQGSSDEQACDTQNINGRFCLIVGKKTFIIWHAHPAGSFPTARTGAGTRVSVQLCLYRPRSH